MDQDQEQQQRMITYFVNRGQEGTQGQGGAVQPPVEGAQDQTVDVTKGMDETASADGRLTRVEDSLGDVHNQLSNHTRNQLSVGTRIPADRHIERTGPTQWHSTLS
jgi:hypothetical protein